jgi:cytosine/adenosine deaminase-related metal-dependent hydrolase
MDISATGSMTLPGESLLLPLEGAIALPGLINSHEHLDFNLFPMLGNRTYQDYTEWGKDIHQQNKTRISQVLKTPLPVRTQWGIYKNLLNGFTTVVNHGRRLDTSTEELVTVYQDCHCLHSLGTEKHWKWKLNGWRRRHGLIVLHIGEGTSRMAEQEIDCLRRWNLFRRPIVGIHGVAMVESQARALRALVWCPDSNYFLYNKTAPIGLLKHRLPVLFGTDSTLSAAWNGWEQLRLARKEGALTDEELLDALTHKAAAVWNFPLLGKLERGYQADLVITQAKDTATLYASNPMNTLYASNPEDLLLVIHRGNIRVFDTSLVERLRTAGFNIGGFSKVSLGKHCKYVQGDLPALIREIRRHDPGAVLPVSAAS